MREDDFNPQSKDAQFATIIARLNAQDRESREYRGDQMKAAERIENLLLIQNGRVRALEKEKWMNRGIGTGLSVLATAAWQWWTTKK